MGWSWDWKNSNPNDVKAYPSIITGWQFSNNMTSGSGLPTRIWDDKNINTSVNYSLSANGNYNAAYDVWFHSTNALTGTSTPSDELMVWLNSTNAWPLGSYVETATVGGTTWKLYRGTHPSGWNVYSFVRTSNTSSSSLNLKDFINHVVYYKNWMSNSRYVTSVQFGTEIFTGSGRMHIYYEIWKNRPDNHPLAEIVQHIVGAENMADPRERLKKFALDGVAEKISMPTYVLHGEDDRQNFVENAYKLRDSLTCEKIVEIIPKESSGSAHCQIDDFTKTFNMYDWIAKKMRD